MPIISGAKETRFVDHHPHPNQNFEGLKGKHSLNLTNSKYILICVKNLDAVVILINHAKVISASFLVLVNNTHIVVG